MDLILTYLFIHSFIHLSIQIASQTIFFLKGHLNMCTLLFYLLSFNSKFKNECFVQQERPLHSSATSYVSPSLDLHQSNRSMVSKTDIVLTMFGGLVLALAVTAIVVSILLNLSTTSSNYSVTDSIISTCWIKSSQLTTGENYFYVFFL